MGLTGDKEWLARLRHVADVESVMSDWANDGAETIAQEARDLVNEGGIPSPNHIVSEPYGPPNTDTGNLVNHINAVELPIPLEAAAISDAEYSLWLEFGTKKMLERPHMRIASANKKGALLKDAAARIRKHTSKRR